MQNFRTETTFLIAFYFFGLEDNREISKVKGRNEDRSRLEVLARSIMSAGYPSVRFTQDETEFPKGGRTTRAEGIPSPDLDATLLADR